VDRVPPADLIEKLLPASAYAYELRGPRRQQAWENIKKLRGLVRRIQNRGYATLARIADHIDSLTAGDESNAVIEALDAVNLMTVHASKGLEFPVVFVVNLARGATGFPSPIRIVAEGADGEPSVSVGPFVSATDEAEREREKHETRRLLYVALTRARDRLYLSSVLKKGVMQPGRGSLGEVLPDSLRQLFSRAASSADGTTADWASRSGRPFDWRICRVPQPSVEAGEPAAAPVPGAADDEPVDYLTPVPATAATLRTSVTRWLRPDETASGVSSPRRDAVIGTLVHRLFQSLDAESTTGGLDLLLHARELLTPDERAMVEDVDATARAALDIWERMRAREDVELLLESGRRYYEVPFSVRLPAESAESAPTEGSTGEPPAVVLRGTIDCLVVRRDGSVVIAEFKTGRPQPSHQQQLDIYVHAARQLFPGAVVSGQLMYG
jgi:ATP-dependent helicase/nuclease subunit A